MNKPKILYFTKGMSMGGTEKVILLLCQFFRDEYDITVASSGGELVSKLEEMGIKHVHISNVNSKNPFTMIRNYCKVKKLIKKNHFDVIHTHHRMAAFYVSLVKPKNVKLVHTMHNSFFDKVGLTNKALKDFTVVCCGNTVREDTLKTYDLKEENVIAICNTIEEKPFTPIKKEDKYYTYGFFGRLTEQKGVDVLVGAFLKMDDPNIRVYIYGDGEYLEGLTQKVKDAHKEENVIFKGVTSEMLQKLQEVDCVVLPSRWEGLPLVVLETFYGQKPILVSDITNNLELVRDNETGYVFKKDDVEDLKEKLEKIAKLDSSKIVKNSYSEYQQKYSNQSFYNNYKNVYLGKL